jgi:4-amino-4-deoxy-L-arabinose transferase-like glycosyltransferase
MLNRGGVVGRDTWDNKPPGVYYLYAAVLHFAPDYSVACSIPVPFSRVSSHQLPCAQIDLAVFEIGYAIGLSVCIWWVARRLFGTSVAIMAALLCAVFSSMLQIIGGGGIADLYVLLPSVVAYGAAAEYARTSRARYLIAAGALGAAAGLFKQTGFILLAGIGLWVVVFETRRVGVGGWRASLRSAGAVALGAATVLALTTALLARSGALGDELNQAFFFNLFYVGRAANTNDFLPQLLSQTWTVFSGSQSGLWLTGFVGVWLLARNWRNWRISLLCVWLGASILTIVAGGSQVHVNYYLALVPPLAILGGYASVSLWSHGSTLQRTAVVAVGMFLLAYSHQLQDHQYGNAWYSRIASNAHSTEEFVAGAIGSGAGSLFVWGNGPQVYALSGRVPASRYLHTLGISYDYALHDQLDPNRTELMATLRESPPQVIAVDSPWLRRAKTLDFPELRAFIGRNYELANAPDNPIFDGWQIYRRRAT